MVDTMPQRPGCGRPVPGRGVGAARDPGAGGAPGPAAGARRDRAVAPTAAPPWWPRRPARHTRRSRGSPRGRRRFLSCESL